MVVCHTTATSGDFRAFNFSARSDSGRRDSGDFVLQPVSRFSKSCDRACRACRFRNRLRNDGMVPRVADDRDISALSAISTFLAALPRGRVVLDLPRASPADCADAGGFAAESLALDAEIICGRICRNDRLHRNLRPICAFDGDRMASQRAQKRAGAFSSALPQTILSRRLQ